jgi:Fe-S cluster assembly protein SufD
MSVTEIGFLDSLLAAATPDAESEQNRHDARLKTRRALALERALSLSVPTTRDEDWRFTDLSPLYRLKLKPHAADGKVDPAVLKTLCFPEAAVRLVFIDGRFDSAASNGVTGGGAASDGAPSEGAVGEGDASEGVMVANLQHVLADEAWQGVRASLEDHLTSIADFENDVFAAANSAYLQDAAVVHVAAGCGLDAPPIQILNVATGHETAASPRLLIVAEQSARCTVIEDYVAVGGMAYLTNSVCEIFVAPNAEVNHIKLQREAETAFHIANTSVRMEADSRYRNWSVATGGKISRHNLNVYQRGVGIDCEMNGLALISGRQLADTHSSIDHALPHGNSRQVHKTIAGGSAHAVFNGKIMVREGAQQTNSSQQSRNMLLSPRASVDTKPQLEIFADDVKCAHGATVGQVDAEEIFYLKSRGLSETDARNLLIYAFAAEVVSRIPVASLVAVLESQILEQTRNKEV